MSKDVFGRNAQLAAADQASANGPSQLTGQQALGDADSSVDRAVGAAFLLLLLHAAAAVGLGINRYADGAWFDFALMVGEPFHLIWKNYPGRLTAYLVEWLPAYGLLRAHVPVRLALGFAHTIWNLAPVVSLAACYRILPRAQRSAALLPAAYFVLFGVLTWGFPTEVWLAAAFAWPAAMIYLYGPNTRGNALAGGLLTLATLFCHEGAILVMPHLVLAGALRWRDRPPRNAIGAVVAACSALALWALAKLLIKPDPIILQSVGYNANHFFAGAITDYPALVKYILIAILAAAAMALALVKPALTKPALLLLGIAGLTTALLDIGPAGAGRYHVRTICICALAGFMGLAILNAHWRRPMATLLSEPTLRLFAGATFALMAMVTVEQNGRFARDWFHYDRVLSDVVNCRAPAHSGCQTSGIVPLPASIVHNPAAWYWGAPLQSILRSDDLQTSVVVRDDLTGGMPVERSGRAKLFFSACVAMRNVFAPSMRCTLRPMPTPVPVPAYIPLSCADAKVLRIGDRRDRALESLTRVVCSTPMWKDGPNSVTMPPPALSDQMHPR